MYMMALEKNTWDNIERTRERSGVATDNNAHFTAEFK
jgi:hypothetical protein